jgi:hypothetical protein
MGFAYAGLGHKNYDLNPEAGALLQSRISEIAKQKPGSRLEQIYRMMQSAMNAADLRLEKQLSDPAAQDRLDAMETLFILPEDFND